MITKEKCMQAFQAWVRSSVRPGDRVLLRLDLNVPTAANGECVDTSRIEAVLPTMRVLLQAQAAVLVVTHWGRPDTDRDQSWSVRPLRALLQDSLQLPVVWQEAWLDGQAPLGPATVSMAENVRFISGETQGDARLAQRMVKGFDHVIMEAFSVSHRQHSSVSGIWQHADSRVLGPSFCYEVASIARFRQQTGLRAAVVGGGKVASKLRFLAQILPQVQRIFVGGKLMGAAMLAQGYDVGTWDIEPASVLEFRKFVQSCQDQGIQLWLPVDCHVRSADGQLRVTAVDEVKAHDTICDIGPDTLQKYSLGAKDCSAILWSGPMGDDRDPQGLAGTKKMAEVVAGVPYSMIGGGHTAAACLRFAPHATFSYNSLGGGAMLYHLQKRQEFWDDIVVEKV